MQESELRQILEAGEGERVEFKRESPRRTALLRDVVAFANAKGGYIICGVDNNGRMVGVESDAAALDNLVQQTRAQIEPPLEIVAESHAFGGRVVTVIHIPLGWDKPYTIAGTGETYVRRGTTSARATSDDLLRLALETRLGAFEDAPVPSATLSDLDPSHFERYLARRVVVPPTGNIGLGVLLRNLGFAAKPPTDPGTESLVPTVAGLLLFGQHPQRFLPQAKVELARFGGDEPGSYADRASIEGTLPEQLEGALAFITRHMRTGMRIEGFQRQEIPEYPLEAIREVLVNALIHRDYSQRGMTIQVRMFFDRWEINSPGRLPGPLTPAQLERGSERLARNPRMAEAMHILGHSEAMGFGLARVRQSLERGGYPALAISESSASLTVRLSDASQVHRRLERLRQFRNQLVHGGGNPRQLQAVEYLLRNDTMTNADYRRLTGATQVTALRDLNDLVARGLLIRHGEKRGAYYTPVEDANPLGATGREP